MVGAGGFEMTHPEAHAPFNIRIFFPEGSPDGLRIITKPNWSGLCIVCPRNRYAEAKKKRVEQFSRSGVYILVGSGEDDSRELYIGEAETIRNRLDLHHAEKDFWNQAIIFTQSGDPLNKAQVQYLESHLVKLAKKYKNWKMDNIQVPREPKLSESEKADSAGYLKEVLLILPVLGVDAFMVGEESQAEISLYRFMGEGWDATGYETGSGFLVQKDSLVCLSAKPNLYPSATTKREQLIKERILIKYGEGYRFEVDHIFNSSSQAASVCADRSCNGRTSWKDENGITLKERQKEEAQ